MSSIFHAHAPKKGAMDRIQRLAWLLAIFMFSFGAVALRSSLAPDIFTDEIVYTRAAMRLAAEGALVWDSGVPFLVHPPLYFLLAGLYNGLTNAANISAYSPGDIFAGVYHTRLLNAVFAGLTALVLFGFSRRLAASQSAFTRRQLLWIGLSAALLFALDPFGVRINRRAMLETLAALLTLLGMLLVWTSVRDGEQQSRDAPPVGVKLLSPRALLAGLALGASLLAKELSFIHLFAILLFIAWEFIQALPGLLQSASGWRRLLLPLRSSAMVNGMAAVGLAGMTYLIYPLWAYSTGRWDLYIEEKLLGFQRMLGLVQLTGWNREGISFFSLLMQRLLDYGSNYLLLALGGAAALWLAIIGLRRDPAARSRRFLAAWGLVIYPFFAFLMLFGSGNDQFFYYLLAPAVLLATAAAFDAQRLAQGALPPPGARRLSELQALEALASVRQQPAKAAGAAAPGLGWRAVLNRGELAMLRLARAAPLILLLLMLPFNLVKWVEKYLAAQDNGYAQLAQFVRLNLPPQAAINATGDPIKFAYFFPERPVYALAQPVQAQAAGVQYFALAPKDVALRYGRITPELAAWIVTNGSQLFAFHGDSYGEIFLLRVEPQTASAANLNPPPPFERRFQVAQAGFVDSLIAMLLLWVTAWLVMAGLLVYTRRDRYQAPGAPSSNVAS